MECKGEREKNGEGKRFRDKNGEIKERTSQVKGNEAAMGATRKEERGTEICKKKVESSG